MRACALPTSAWEAFAFKSLVPLKSGLLPVVVWMVPANSGLEFQVARVKQVREVVRFGPVVRPGSRCTHLAAGDSLDGVDVAGAECVGADGA